MVEKFKDDKGPNRGPVINGQLPLDKHPEFFLSLNKNDDSDPVMSEYTDLRLQEHLFNRMGMESGRSYGSGELGLSDLMGKIKKIEDDNPEIQSLFTSHVNFMIKEGRES